MKSTLTIALCFVMSLGVFSQNLITQAKPYGKKEWGYINQNGEFIINPIYKKCSEFSENGLAVIYESKQLLFINTNGKILTTELRDFRLKEVFGFGLQGYHDGMVAVKKNDKWGYLDSKGKVAVELKYDKVTIFDGGYAIAKTENDFFVINHSGEETKIENPEVDAVKKFSEGLAPFNNDDSKSGFIDTHGKIAIPAQFLSVGYFFDGLAWAKTFDKKVGYINKNGEWVIEAQFVSAKNFDSFSGVARVKTTDKWAYVTKKGEIININDTENWGDFSEGLAKGKKDGKWGFYNFKGEWVIVPEFEAVRSFKNGFAAVKKGGKWGFINKSGKQIIEPQFSAIKDMERVN